MKEWSMKVHLLTILIENEHRVSILLNIRLVSNCSKKVSVLESLKRNYLPSIFYNNYEQSFERTLTLRNDFKFCRELLTDKFVLVTFYANSFVAPMIRWRVFSKFLKDVIPNEESWRTTNR